MLLLDCEASEGIDTSFFKGRINSASLVDNLKLDTGKKYPTNCTHFVTMLFESSVAPPKAKVIQVGSPLNNSLYSEQEGISAHIMLSAISPTHKNRMH